MGYTYCLAWSDELKAAEARRFRAERKLRCLKSNLDHITIDDFEELMHQIEETQKELRDAASLKTRLLSNPEHNP